MAIAYLLTNTVTGLRYVGKTTQTLEARWKRHVRDAVRQRRVMLHRAILKYGAAAFVRETIGEYDTGAEALAGEIEWIARLGTKAPNGYNLTEGGDGARGLIPGPETRAKMRAWQVGKTISAEQRAKMSATRTGMKVGPQSEVAKSRKSEALLGHEMSAETRAKIGDANRGRPAHNKGSVHTEESRAKIRAAWAARKAAGIKSRRGPMSDEQKANLRAKAIARGGHPHTPESREKIRAALTGKPLTEERKANISRARRTQSEEPHDTT